MLNCMAITIIKQNIKINSFVVNKMHWHITAIKITDETIDQIKEFCYLGSLIPDDYKLTKNKKQKNTYSKTNITKIRDCY